MIGLPRNRKVPPPDPRAQAAEPVAPHTDTEARRRLDRALAGGIAWAVVARWTVQVFSWTSSLIVARLLTPEDFGIVGMAWVYIGLVNLVNELGLGTAIVQKKTLDEDEARDLAGVALLSGLAFFALSFALSWPLAAFFRSPALQPVIAAYGLIYVTGALRMVPMALLTRTLQFRRFATVSLVEAGTATGATLALALAGLGYWAIVVGQILGAAVGPVLANSFRPVRPRRVRSLARVRATIVFGSRLVVARVSWYAYSNADFAIIGRRLGEAALGAYSLGFQLASIPIDRITAVVSQVGPAIFARVQGDVAELRRYFLRLGEALSIAVFPLAFGLALVADRFVLVLLGEKWRAAVAPLVVLACSTGLRAIGSLSNQMLIAAGRADVTMRFSVAGLFVLPPAFLLGAQLAGPVGVAIAWLVVHPLVISVPVTVHACRLTRSTARQLVSALAPASAASAVMAAAVLVVRALDGGLPGPFALALEILAGAAAYVGLLLTAFRERSRAFLAFVRSLRNK